MHDTESSSAVHDCSINSFSLDFLCFAFVCLFSVITGPQRSGVVGARSRIEVITESSRQKIPFTHFLSFPLYKGGMENKIDEFKVKVLKDCFEVTFLSVNTVFDENIQEQ